MVARFIASSCSLTRPFRLALVLITLLLTLPQMAWGVTEEVTKTITFNKAVSTVSSNINNSTMSVSVNEQVGGASTTYDGEVNIWDSDGLLTEYSCSDGGGAVFTLKSTATYGQIFTIEIPGNYPAIPTQVTLKVGWEHAKSSGASGEIVAKIQVGDYDTGSLVGNTDPVIEDYANNHPFLSTQTSKQHFGSDALVYTANNRNGLGTNRETRKSLFIYVSLNGNDVQEYPTTFTIKEATITYNREAYGPVVAGIHVGDDNTSNVLSDDYSSVSYDEGSKTLTLKGVNLNSATGNNNITASSALTIHLEGYNNVGEINVYDGSITSALVVTATTNETLPGYLEYSNMAGHFEWNYQNGLKGKTENNKYFIYSESTNPYIIYATGYKGNNGEYWVSEGDIMGYDNEGNTASLDVNTGATVVNSQNNASIDYFKVSSSSQSCYLYPAILADMNLVTKAYLLFDWGTCTNKSVKIQVRGLEPNQPYPTYDGKDYSEEVSLPSTGGLVEIPLTGTITSDNVQLYFSSSTGEFSFIPISVGFLKNTTPTDYGLTIAGTAVTSANAGNVFNDATNPRVVFTPATESNPTNTLTLNAYQNNSNSKIASSLPNLTIVINGENSIGDNGGRDGFIESTNANATLTFKKGSANSTLELHSNNDDAVVQGFASVSYDETYYRYSSAVKYDTSEKKYTGRYGLQNLLTITTTPQYLIWIEGEQVSDETKNNLAGGKATFTPGTNTTPNTLLLNGASISSMTAIESDLDNLTISLIGNNTVSAAYHAGYNSIYSFNPNATLTIKKAGDAECELDFITYGEDPVIKGFASVSYDGLNFASKTGTTLDGADTKDAILTSATIYPLWVGGTLVTEANKGKILGENNTTATFDGTKTLTLNGAELDEPIVVGMNDLTIHLIGSNTISGFNDFYKIDGIIPATTNTSGKLTFTSAVDGTTGKATGSLKFQYVNSPVIDNSFNIKYENNLGIFLNGDPEIKAKYAPTFLFAKRDQTSGDEVSPAEYVGASETLETTYGVAFKAPKPEFDNGYALGGDSTRYTYSYTPTGIVEIPITATDPSTGKNTFGEMNILKAGTVTITCTFPGNLQNEACSASYTLKVNKADPTISFKKEGNAITSDNTTYGSNYVFPTLDYPNDITEITYSSSNEAVAKYTNNVWSIVGAGETTITATSTANDCYNSASATLTLTVGKGTPTLTFSAATTEATYGEAFTPPTLTKPDDVNVTYRSDNVAVATVNASTGEVTILYPGDARITASFAGDNNYNAATDASYSIAVHPSAPTLSIESGAYYIGQEITATETVPGDIGSGLYIYQGETFINQVTAPPYTYPFNNVGVFSVKAKTIYVRSGGTNLSPINSEETKATIVINNQPTFTASVGVNAYNETNPQSGNVAVQLEVTNLQANCTLRYYVGNDASKAVNYDAQNPIILSETNTINAYIRYTDNTVTPNIVYDSAPVSKTYTVKQEVVDPFGNDLSYRTCYLSDYSLNKPDGIKVYIITGVSGNSVTTTAIDYIPQGVAVLLEKDGNAPAGGYVAETYTGAVGNFSGNMLKYANAEVTVTDDLYILYNNEFVKATGVIPIENCYLDLSSVNPSRGMYDIGDGTTAIKGITLSEGEEAWYDLQGRRIERPTKPGLYIRNGKKVVVNNK